MRTKQPNILIITSHDTGRHLGCYGIEQVNSPCIDSLAAEGVRMASYFATAPICCASRASMMTGRYPQSHGLLDLCFPPFNWALHAEERHLSNLLHDAGYHTRLFGLQHEVNGVELSRLGFDVLPRPSKTAPAADVVAAEVTTFLEEQQASKRPFYAQVGFFETHSPFTWGGAEPDESKGIFIPPYIKSSDPILGMARELQGNIRKMDAAVGTIVDALTDNGLAEDTILVYTTDHGIEFPRAKWTLYDPGIGIAMVIRWPQGGVGGGRACDHLQSNVDFLPTILELTGIPIPENVEGRSFARALAGRGSTPPVRSEVFATYIKTQNSRCIRTRDFKLIRNFDIGRYYHKPVDFTDYDDYGVAPNLELYDLRSDPNEFKNVAGDASYSEIRRELGRTLYQWLKDVDDPILAGPMRTRFYDSSLKGLLSDASEVPDNCST